MSFSNLITDARHAFAIAAQKISTIGRFLMGPAKTALAAALKAEPTIEAITGDFAPAAVAIERIGFSIIGHIAHAIDSGAAATAAGGLNLELDKALLDDIRTILPLLKMHAPDIVQPSIPVATPA